MQRTAVGLVGLARSVGLMALMVALLSACEGQAATVPVGAQEVRVTTTATEVRLEPATVRAGDVYFVIEQPDDPTGHAGFSFVHRGRGESDPLPMSDEDVALLASDSAPQGFAYDSGWGRLQMFRLIPGKYVFMVGGGEPGVPPLSVTALEVLP